MISMQDFIVVSKADMNEGFSSGTVTKAALFFTKKYMFVVPMESISVLGNTTTDTTTNASEVLDSILPTLSEQSVAEFEEQMMKKLPHPRVYEISNLETFSINVGWWIFGGMTIKKKDGARQTINVQPKDMRAKIAEFYGQ